MVLGSIPAHLQMGILICRWPSEHRPGAVSPCWSFCVPLQSHPRRCSVPWCCRNRFPCPLASSWVWPVGGVSTEAEGGRLVRAGYLLLPSPIAPPQTCGVFYQSPHSSRAAFSTAVIVPIASAIASPPSPCSLSLLAPGCYINPSHTL